MSTDDAQTPDERARDEARRATGTAVLAMARAAGAEVSERPIWPGKTFTVRDVARPEAGIRFTLMLASAARHKLHGYLRLARQDGLSWQDIGTALGLAGEAGERGITLAEAAFGYAAGAARARPFDTLWFSWTCPACHGSISDYGPAAGHPDDAEHGHAEGCARHAAAVAAYQARWDDAD